MHVILIQVCLHDNNHIKSMENHVHMEVQFHIKIGLNSVKIIILNDNYSTCIYNVCDLS